MAAGDTKQQAQGLGRQIPIVCPGHTRPLAELSFCHVPEENRTLLVSACHDRMPMVRDGYTGDWIGTFSGHKGAVWSCRLDPSGNLAATASGDFEAHVWDAITGQNLYTLQHGHIVKSCDFSPNSRRLATGGHEGILRIYNLASAAVATVAGENPSLVPLEIHQASTKIAINKVIWFSDTVVLAGCGDGGIRVWTVEEPDSADSSVVSSTEPTHVVFTEQGREIRDMEITKVETTGMQVLTVAVGDKVYFFEVSTSEEPKLLHKYTMPIHFREEGGASLHKSGTKFVAGGSDLWVRVFDFETGKELECLKGHHGPIRCLRYSPDGSLYASGSEDGTIRLWKTNPEG